MMTTHFKDRPEPPRFGLILLAAGLGKRMRSPLPKVLHDMGGKPLIFHVLKHVHDVNPKIPVAIVVGHGREKVEEFVKNEPHLHGMSITFIVQSEQKGTGHAARCAMDSPWGLERIAEKTSVLVLPGDLPLITSELIREVTLSLGKSEVIRVLTSHLQNPTGYGRILRKNKSGSVTRIVEEKDATAQERKINEVGTSIYLFEPNFMSRSLKKLKPVNAQGEYYLTDLISLASKEKKKVADLIWKEADDLRGVNDPWELAQARDLFNLRCVSTWARQGVQFLSPQTVRIEVGVELGENVTIDAGVILQGTTKIGNQTQIQSHVVLKNAEVSHDVVIKSGTIVEDSQIDAFAQLGPNAHLRPGSIVGKKVKIGNFVELKKTRVQENSSIAHLSYLGDAEVGRNVNIGCGFVTCNYDGRVIQGERKHKTVIEDDVFLGSACQAVAPVRIGRGSYIASGSTITEDVEADALAIARARQINKPGYARKLKSSR